MSPPVIILIVVGVVVLLPLIYVLAIYNRLVSIRAHMRESWSDVDVELKRRYELIPNLVETVKGYATHERETLEQVTRLRNQAAAEHDDLSSQSRDEQALIEGLRRIFVVVEDYPELKSDKNFRQLQAELANTEDRIAAARRFFNGNVRELNQLVEMFPSNLIAGAFGFSRSEYFQLDDDRQRAVPKVTLDA
ncbi:MAG: LemA family protein [bacterium]|nr:LemA family protein [bacterium]